MRIGRLWRIDMAARLDSLFQKTAVRYLLAVATVASTFAVRIWLIPYTGTGAPFVLFFGAVLVASLFGGVGPGVCALVLSLPLAVYMFVTRAGYPPLQAAVQALLFAIDGTIVIYLTFLMKKWRLALQDANWQLRDANEEIRRSMARTRDVIDLAPDAFLQADLKAQFTDVNQAACRLLGYDRDELVGKKTIVDLIPPEDVPRLASTRDYLLSPGKVDVGEWTLMRKNGTPVPVEASAKILPDGRWQAFGRDISERKRIERTLQESEERFRLTIDEAPIGIALVALDGRFVRVNRALCEIVGYSSGELTELTFQAITHPDDRDTDRAAAGQLVRGEIPRYQREKRYLSKDGTIVDVMLNTSILRDRDGTPRYFISQIEDIRQRKQAETALKESEQRLNLALDSAQIGMWDLDLLTDTSVRSLRHDQIFGYSSPSPTWGSAIFMTHVVPEDRDVAERAFEHAFTSDSFDMECRILWPDNSIHWISAKGRVFRNPAGHPVRMMGTVADITEQKRAEEALERSERDFRELAESMPQIVWATTVNGWNIYFNQQWVDYTGLTLEESYGEGWITPFHPDDRQRAWDAWKRATQYGDTYSLESRLRRADGVYRWWLIRGVPQFSANGEISKWFGTCTDIEQLKVAEQRLKESEAKFSGIIAISADAIISIDDERRITMFNRGAERIFGYSEAEVIGTPFDNLIPERLRSVHRQHVERFAAGDVIARGMGERLTTIAGLRKNGEEFPAEAAISKLRIGDQTLLTVALRDITKRKRIEEDLKAANASLDAIVENVPLMLFIKDATSLRFLRFNRAGEELLGSPRENFTGKSDYDLWPQAQAEFFVEKDRETLKSGKVVDIPEEEIQTPDKGVRILHTKKVPILDSAGHPLYLLGISEDITERSVLEKEQRFLAEANVALSASLDYEQTLASVARLAVQHVADWCAVNIMDKSGRLTRLALATADPAKAAVRAALERTPPSPAHPDLAWSVIEGGRALVVEHVTPEFLESMAQGPEHLKALLATGLTSLMAVPLEMRGQTLGVLVFGSSTPSHVYGQDDLRLAKALADRAAVAIENARLYRASVNATQLRDQVLGVVAHDLRNPLSAILLQAGSLKRRGPEPDRRSQKPGEAIESAVTRMNRLIQDLLDVALMEAGQLTIQPARLSTRELIVEAADLQRPLASSSSLELRVDVDDVPEIWGDRDRLLQVLENLIGNAIKFTEAGGWIGVGATSRDHEVVFWVSDTGSGIASEDLPRVFDRFWQATRAGRQGAGLGLPITKGIVEAHGGRIWVESTPGRGTTFSFTIPKAAPERMDPLTPEGVSETAAHA
jgi:PAS domain S-box-containing protein